MAKDFPAIGGICAVVGSIANLYADVARAIVVDKIVSSTDHLYQDKFLAKAVTEAVEYLISER